MQPPLCRALQNPSCPLELGDESPGRRGVTGGPVGHFARPTAVREAQPLMLHPDLFVAGETPACQVAPRSAALSPLILRELAAAGSGGSVSIILPTDFPGTALTATAWAAPPLELSFFSPKDFLCCQGLPR